jgi:plasmid stabilization system protein ParE
MWTESAWRDLEEVADYIAKDSTHYAAAFVREAREAARTLACLAERGRVEEGNGVKPKLYTLQDGKRMPVTAPKSRYRNREMYASSDLGEFF